MNITSLAIRDVWVVTPTRSDDHRGWFTETWSREKLGAAGRAIDFCQENHSFSRDHGTVRGLHFQCPPYAQDKLVRVVRGKIWDVAVDIRRKSETYGRWVAVEISAQAGNQLLVPKGFAHGFCTLEPDTEVVYMVSAAYSSQHDAGILWNDPDLAIEWPTHASKLSEKDRTAPRLRNIVSPF